MRSMRTRATNRPEQPGAPAPHAGKCAARFLALALAACNHHCARSGPEAGRAGSDAASESASSAAKHHAASPDCTRCHAAETTSWSSSHHAQASGLTLHSERFDGRPRTFAAVRVTPELRSGRPVFRIRDGAGERVWEATGTIGVAPLQEYLLADARGRVVVAPIAWDTLDRKSVV